MGVPRRPALLVAEDHGPHVPRVAGAASRAAIIFIGFNLTFFPQFIARLPRHAAPLPRVPAGVPGAERDVDGRRLDPRRRLPAAADLPRLVAALRRGRAGEPVGRDRARVADAVAAADRELREHAGRHARRRTPTRTARSRSMSDASHVRRRRASAVRSRTTSTALEQQHERVARSGCGSSSLTEVLFFGGLFLAYTVYRVAVPGRLRAREPPPRRHARRDQHRRPDRLEPDDGAGRARRAARASAGRIVIFLVLTMVLGAVFLGIKAIEYGAQVPRAPRPGPRLPSSTGRAPPHAQIFFSLYFVMTGLHALHMVIGIGDPRVCSSWQAWRGALSRRRTTARSRSIGPLLALRRHRLDLPLPAALPDRAALTDERRARITSFRSRSTSRSSPR